MSDTEAGETVTVIAGEAVNVMLALADFDGSAELAARIDTAELGTGVGAVYRPEEVTVPSAALPPATPLTDQFTAEFELPATLALNDWV